jgi:hypothetical protein
MRNSPECVVPLVDKWCSRALLKPVKELERILGCKPLHETRQLSSASAATFPRETGTRSSNQYEFETRIWDVP